MRKNLILVGFSGNFYDIVEEIIKQKRYKILGYFDLHDHKDKKFKYLGNDKDNIKVFKKEKKLLTISGVGSGIKLKNKLFNLYKTQTINLIFKKSFISKYVKLRNDSGIIILNNTVLKSFVKIDSNVFINSNCVIGHHSRIKKNTSI